MKLYKEKFSTSINILEEFNVGLSVTFVIFPTRSSSTYLAINVLRNVLILSKLVMYGADEGIFHLKLYSMGLNLFTSTAITIDFY